MFRETYVIMSKTRHGIMASAAVFFPSALVATGANAHPSAGTALRIAMTKWIKFGPY